MKECKQILIWKTDNPNYDVMMVGLICKNDESDHREDDFALRKKKDDNNCTSTARIWRR